MYRSNNPASDFKNGAVVFL